MMEQKKRLKSEKTSGKWSLRYNKGMEEPECFYWAMMITPVLQQLFLVENVSKCMTRWSHWGFVVVYKAEAPEGPRRLIAGLRGA